MGLFPPLRIRIDGRLAFPDRQEADVTHPAFASVSGCPREFIRAPLAPALKYRSASKARRERLTN
jgi:hypothetical protein